MSRSYESVVQEASQKGTSAFSFSKTYPAYILLALALALSFLVWEVVDNKVASDNTAAFVKATSSVQTRLNNSVKEHLQIVKSMQGLYLNYPFVVRDVFELYGSISEETASSIQSVLYAPYVKGEALGGHEFYAQREQYYSYKVKPEGIRDFYCPVFYIVPLAKNEVALGFDLATEPDALKPIEKARDNNVITASVFYPIRKEPDTLGLQIFAPVYLSDSSVANEELRRRHFDGAVILEVVAEEFFKNSIGTSTASDTAIYFAFYDVDDQGKKKAIFHSENYADIPEGHRPLLEQSLRIDIADRSIEVAFATVPGFGGEFSNNLPILSFIGAIVTSLLFFAFTFSILTSRARAQDLAERMTRSQRRIVDSSRDLIGITTLDGIFQSMNPASKIVLEYEADDLIQQSMYDLIVEEDREKVRKTIDAATDEASFGYDVRMASRNGEVKWISWNCTVSKTDGLIYNIGRDITEQKLAQEQVELTSKQVELARLATEEVARFKSQFMEQASFEFRTTLTSIRGYLQLATTNDIPLTPEEEKEYLNIAYESAEDLLSLVSDLLDVAEGESQDSDAALTLTALSIKSSIGDICDAITRSMQDQTITFDLSIEESDNYAMTADGVALEQSLREFISALTIGLNSAKIAFYVQVNTYEKLVEIQMLCPANQGVAEMISIFRNTPTGKVVDLLRQDKDNIIFRITTAISRIKLMNGTAITESLGEDGNVVMITMPARKSRFVKKGQKA